MRLIYVKLTCVVDALPVPLGSRRRFGGVEGESVGVEPVRQGQLVAADLGTQCSHTTSKTSHT